MPILPTRVPPFKPKKDVKVTWDNFRKGLNTLLKETELDGTELAQADNLMLVGKGVPTRRWGTDLYFLSAATGSVRGLHGLYESGGTNQLLCLTDQGVLTKKSSASYSIITGASWASGYDASMTQLDDDVYITTGQREMVRYSSPTLYSFPTIAIPTGAFATQISGVSGTNSYSYRISALSNVGETVGSAITEAGDCPQDLTAGSVKVTWTGVSTASGVLQGYNIYGRDYSDERFLGSVAANNTTFIDNGEAIPQEFTYPPTADSTGGIVAKYVIRFEDRLIFAGIPGEPDKVVISGHQPFHEKFDWSYGGGWQKVEPDAGDNITGLSVFEGKIIIFKEKSIWQMVLSSKQVGNFSVVVPILQLITASHGCISHKTIVPVENDTFFLSRNGVYALGYEPNIFNAIRTTEISVKVRPFFQNLSVSNKKSACAEFHKNKYVISFPGKDKTIVYDRERLAWMGPWTIDANALMVYYDSSGEDKLIYGSDTEPKAYDFSAGYSNDDGTVIKTELRTKKEDFGDWFQFKHIKNISTLFRNVSGTINTDIRLQDRKGQVTTAKSFSITTTTSNAGWGADGWGVALFGDSEESGSALDINEIYRYARLNKAARNIQLTIKTTNTNDNYELLSIRIIGKPLGEGFTPSSEKV